MARAGRDARGGVQSGRGRARRGRAQPARARALRRLRRRCSPTRRSTPCGSSRRRRCMRSRSSTRCAPASTCSARSRCRSISPNASACSRRSARHPHLQVMIGFVRRFDPSYRDAFDKIAKGAIGRPFMVRSQTCDKNDPDGFFVRFAPTSGGLFLDCSVHDIDLARWLLGNPRAEARVRERHDRDSRRPARMRRYRQRRRHLRIRGRAARGVLRVADDGARPRHADAK